MGFVVSFFFLTRISFFTKEIENSKILLGFDHRIRYKRNSETLLLFFSVFV